MRVFGIDPGSHFMGYGVVEKNGGQLVHVDNGCLRPKPAASLPERLEQIHRALLQALTTYRPDAVAVEQVFFAKNVASALKLGQSRGVALLAAAQSGLPVFEYSATAIKQATTGYGRAGKEQIQKMVQMILKLPELAEENASDALAVAICHLHTNQVLKS